VQLEEDEGDRDNTRQSWMRHPVKSPQLLENITNQQLKSFCSFVHTADADATQLDSCASRRRCNIGLNETRLERRSYDPAVPVTDE